MAIVAVVLPTAAAAQNGTVTGTVTNAATAAPLVGRSVTFCTTTPTNQCVGSPSTDASGNYSISLAPGTWFAYTNNFNSLGFINEIYDNIPCPGVCTFTLATTIGTPIVVASGGTLSGRNFALAAGGSIAGTVTSTSTGAPIQSVSIQVFSRSGTQSVFAGSTSTDAAGAYTMSGLPVGTYFAYTDASFAGFLNEIYDNIPCVGSCSSITAIDTGTPIVVTGTGTVSGRDFALAPGGSIAGVVTSASGGGAIQNVGVSVYTRIGTQTFFAGSGSSNTAGVFTVSGLATGTYFALTSAANAGFTSEIFDNILCPGNCNTTTAVNSGVPIAVTAGATTNGINFALDPGARITGTILNAMTSAPMQFVNVQAYTRIGLAVTFVGSASTNASGVYSIGGLPAGTYALLTSTNLAINEIYNNLPCSGSCSSTDAVNIGTPVNVSRGATTSGRDFQLDPGGAVSGTITDALSSAPLSGVTVQLYRQVGTSAFFVSAGSSDSSGVYTVGGLLSGSYFAVAFPSSAYLREVFGGPQCLVSCQTAEILAGTPIAVTTGATTPGKNLALDAGGTITGTVTNAATSAPLANVTILFPISATSSSGFSTNAAGVFTITGLPTGIYRVGTSAGQYLNEGYNNVACPGGSCSSSFITTSGTPIGVTGGTTTSGINFALDPRLTAPGPPFALTATATGGNVQITWSPPGSGGVATSYILEAGLSPGTTLGTLPTTATSLSVPGVGPGTYYLRVRAVNAFGTGPASSEFALIVGNGGSALPNAPTNLTAWMSEGRLTMTWTAPATGQTPTSYVLEAGSAVGLSNLAVVELGTRSFTFDPIPSGFFFLRVRSKAGGLVSAPTVDVMINVGNVPAPPSPPQNFFINLSGSTATLNWTAPAIGTATSYIIEAGTATGLANIGVVNTGTTATTLAVPGVPSGIYYLRVRAANAQGASPVSNERVLTVP